MAPSITQPASVATTIDAAAASKKRKAPETLFGTDPHPKDKTQEEEEDDDDDDESPTSINVDFAFLTPDPAVDGQALRGLLQQLFYTHAPTLNLYTLTDDILTHASQLGIGTVVKLDSDEAGTNPQQQPQAAEEEPDPYALIAALPSSSQAAPDVLLPYFRARLSSAHAFTTALNAAHSQNALLILIHERMVNLPAALAPPLYRILLSELRPYLQRRASATAELTQEGKALAHKLGQVGEAASSSGAQVLLFTRLYSDAAFSDDEDDEMDDAVAAGDGGTPASKSKSSFAQRRAKRRRAERAQQQQRGAPSGGAAAATGEEGSTLHYFHPEDEILIKYATQSHTFRFPAPPSAVSSFEAPIFGRLFLLPLAVLLDASELTLGAGGSGESGAGAGGDAGADAEVKLGPALVELERVLAADPANA